MTAQLRITSEPGNVRMARRFVGDTLESWGLSELTEVAVLLTSELVTNALLHGHGDIQVEVTKRSDCVRVTVHDASGSRPQLRADGAMATGGRGLALVESMAEQWGVEMGASRGKSVWFDLEAR